MRVLVTGVNGQLGYAVLRELLSRGQEAAGSGSSLQPRGEEPLPACPYLPMDLRRPEQIRRTLEIFRPEAVIHCGAWTAVDAAELPENRELVFAVNAGGTEALAGACAALGSKLLYVSTDYVFDGRGERPWHPDLDLPRPLNVYGQSKLAGEQALRRQTERFFLVRTSWLYGPNGGNFVRTMLRQGAVRKSVRVVEDQIGTPTYAPDLARLLADLIETERFGCYHAANEGGFLSWAAFAEEIFRRAGLETEVVPVSTAAYGRALARRPANSRLDTGKLKEAGFAPLPSWQDALDRYLALLPAGEEQGGL